MKTAKKILVFLLAMLLGAGAAITVLQFATPYQPFRKEGTTLDETAALSLSVERTSTNEQTITATVKDTDGTVNPNHQSVTFGFAWSEAVTGEPLENFIVWRTNGNTVTIGCKKAFNTPIIVTCTSTIDRSKFANVRLGYEKRIQTLKMVDRVITANAPLTNEVYRIEHAGTTSPIYFIRELTYSGGTVINNVHSMITIAPTDELKTLLLQISPITNCYDYTKSGINLTKPFGLVFYNLLNPIAGNIGSQVGPITQDVIQAVNECTKDFLVTITIYHANANETFRCYVDLNLT